MGRAEIPMFTDSAVSYQLLETERRVDSTATQTVGSKVTTALHFRVVR